MYIEVIKNKANKSATLLRECHRQDGKVVKRTLANLSALPDEVIENLRLALRGGPLIEPKDLPERLRTEQSTPWGHVVAVLDAMGRLDMAGLIDPSPGRERDIVMGLLAARILNPRSKLATTVFWSSCSLASELGIEDCGVDDVYDAMDWLLERKDAIELRLARRHLRDGDMIFLDVSSSYYEGQKSTLTCKDGAKEGAKDGAKKGGKKLAKKNSKDNGKEGTKESSTDDDDDDDESDDDMRGLVRHGYSRDKKRGKPQINYGLVADKDGRPISIDVYPGNTSDAKIFLPTVEKIRNKFSLSRIVMVGDRGMISSKDITILKKTPGVDWITALRSTSIKTLIVNPGFPVTLFDERNICEFMAPKEFPGERLAVCRNPLLKARREQKRIDLIGKTREMLDKIVARVSSGKLKNREAIGLAVGKVINKRQVAKHFIVDIKDNYFSYSLNDESIAKESLLDGIYIIRTSLPPDVILIDDCVRQYKNLAQVERAFRTMKSCGLRIRPIFHYLDSRIICHIFMTMLSYYVIWHLKEVWRELTFGDEEQELKKRRDPVAPAKRSDSAQKKASSKVNGEGLMVQDFDSLLNNLADVRKVVLAYTSPDGGNEQKFELKPSYTPIQQKAYQLLENIPVYP